MQMHDGCSGVIHRTVLKVHPARQIDILAIHKKTFIEQPDFAERFYAQKHKTTGQKRNILLFIVIGET